MAKNTLSEVRRVEPVEGHPDGTFHGFWSGYVVRWETEDGRYEAKSKNGVRGINVPCVVVVESGQFTCASS